MTTPEAASRPFDAGRFSFGNTKSLSTPPEKFASGGVISSGANRATLQGRLGLIPIAEIESQPCARRQIFSPGKRFFSSICRRRTQHAIHFSPPYTTARFFRSKSVWCWIRRRSENPDSPVRHSAANQDWRVPGRRKPPSRRTCLAPPPKRRSLPGVPSKGRFSARPSNLSRPTS